MSLMQKVEVVDAGSEIFNLFDWVVELGSGFVDEFEEFLSVWVVFGHSTFLFEL